MKNFFLTISLITFIVLLIPNNVFATSRVSSTPSSAVLDENSGSATFTIALDEPIIAPDESGAAYVTLNITGGSGRLSFSTSSITFAASEWSTTKTLTVSTIDDFVKNATSSANITVRAQSNSEYYSNFTYTIYITINDDDIMARRTGGSSIIYGCRDSDALNFDRFSAHLQSLCLYKNVATSIDVKTSTSSSGVMGGSAREVSFGGVALPPSYNNSEIKGINTDLYFGMNSVQVKILQKFLIDQNKGLAAKALKENGVTSYFGKLCKQALLEWQNSVGIKNANGVFGSKTRQKIQEL